MLVLECPRRRIPRCSIMRRAHACARTRVHARAPMRTKIRGGALVLGVPQKGSHYYFLAHNFRIHAHWTLLHP